MELAIIARFHARPGEARTVERALLGNLGPTRAEPGCLDIHVFRSTRDPQLFFVHSRWKNEAAFEAHGALPRMVLFVERLEALTDHPFEARRLEQIG